MEGRVVVRRGKGDHGGGQLGEEVEWRLRDAIIKVEGKREGEIEYQESRIQWPVLQHHQPQLPLEHPQHLTLPQL